MKLQQFLLAALVTGLLASEATADGFLLRNGTEMRGVVTASDDGHVTLKLDAPAGATVTLARDQIDPHSWYVIRSNAIGEDAAAHLVLARYCIANNLYYAAERELERAASSSAELAPAAAQLRGEARESGARRLIVLAREAIAKNDLAHAASLAATVARRYEETAAAGDALGVVDDIARRRSELEQARIAESQRRVSEQKAQARVATLREFVDRLEQARRQNVVGLRSKELSGAQAAFTGAARKFATVVADIDARSGEKDDEIDARLREIRTNAITEEVEVHINMGSLYLVRGSYTTAEQHANEALAIDPRSPYAREFRARVELAAGEAAGNRGRARRTR